MGSATLSDSAAAAVESRKLAGARTRIVVIWIDWYAYHIARFRAIAQHPVFQGRAIGIELVGGAGLHGRMVFRASERQGLPIVTLFPDGSWSDIGQYRMARRLWTELNRISPEVVMVPGYYTLPGLASVFWARLHGKRAVLMSESTRQDHRRRPLLEGAKRAVLPRLFHAAIAGGKRQAAYLRDLGFAPAKIAGLYDVVDNEYFAEQAAGHRRQTSAESLHLPGRYFLSVGRLAPEKNIDGLIRAFALYRQRGGTWSLVIVGDGPLASGLKRQVSDAGLDGEVVFAGMKDTRAMMPYYAFAGCFMLPSWREPWGLVANEAMSTGLPLIISNRCGCSDDLLEDGANGYVFDPDNMEQLADLMSTMSGLNSSQRLNMGEKSRQIVARYSLATWGEEVVRIAGYTV
ncbi:MAG: glycosyltransferase family 4 protein [Bryobacteraceae bacterium]